MSAPLALAAVTALAAAAAVRSGRMVGSASKRRQPPSATLIGSTPADQESARLRMVNLLSEMSPTPEQLALQYASISNVWLIEWLRDISGSRKEGRFLRADAPSALALAVDIEMGVIELHEAIDHLTREGVGKFNDAAGEITAMTRDMPPAAVFSNPKLIRNVWLIHHSRSPGISDEGFRFGVERVEGLGYTGSGYTYAGQEPGYGFAYLPSDRDRYGENWGGTPKYGDRVYAFFVPWAIYAWHAGDEEPQVIFWGPSARNIVEISKEELRTGSGYRDLWVIKGLDPDQPGRTISTETASDIVDWLEQNWGQYRRILGQQLDRVRRRVERGWRYEQVGEQEYRLPWSQEPRTRKVYKDIHKGPGKGGPRRP